MVPVGGVVENIVGCGEVAEETEGRGDEVGPIVVVGCRVEGCGDIEATTGAVVDPGVGVTVGNGCEQTTGSKHNAASHINSVLPLLFVMMV